MNRYSTILNKKLHKDRRYLSAGLVVVAVLISLNLFLRFSQNSPWFDNFSNFINQTLYQKDPATVAQKSKLIKELKQPESEVNSLTKLEASKIIDRLLNPEKYSKPYQFWSDIKAKIITNTWIYIFFILLVVGMAWYYGGQKSFVLIATILSTTYFFYDIISLFSFSFFVQGLAALSFSAILYALPFESPIDKREERIHEYEMSIHGYEEKVIGLESYINQLRKDTSDKQELIAVLEHEKQQAIRGRTEAIRAKEEMQGYKERGRGLKIGVFGDSDIDDNDIIKVIMTTLASQGIVIEKKDIQIIETDYGKMTNAGPKAFIQNERYEKKWLILGPHPHKIEEFPHGIERFITDNEDWCHTKYKQCLDSSGTTLKAINKNNLAKAVSVLGAEE
ncbi:MAG: hypothetical protein Q7S09_04185 [bacterium]|nr:hypothetical protein [bacterium]